MDGEYALRHDCGHQQPRTEQDGRTVRVPELGQDLPHDGEEVVCAYADSEELGQLRGDHNQSHPVDVTEEHRLAEEVRDKT